MVLNLVPILRIGVRAVADAVRIHRAANGDGAAGAEVIRTFVLADAVGGRIGAAALGGGYLSAGDANIAAAAGACIGAITIDSRASSNTRTSIISKIFPTSIIYNIRIDMISAIATRSCNLSAGDADIAACIMYTIICYETASYAGSSTTASGIHNTCRNADVTTCDTLLAPSSANTCCSTTASGCNISAIDGDATTVLTKTTTDAGHHNATCGVDSTAVNNDIAAVNIVAAANTSTITVAAGVKCAAALDGEGLA